jgi:hypothetical protein
MYLYAITDQPELPVPPEPGLEGASLLSLACRDVSAVVSRLATVTVPATKPNLWRHEAVVETLMAGRAVLPLRFGTVLTDEAAVRSLLAAHYADFVASLDRVRGRVELGLRVLWNGDRRPLAVDRRSRFGGQPSAVSGHSYLLARLEEERSRQAWRDRAEAVAAELHTPLSRLAAESTRQVLITSGLLLSAAYLVQYSQVAAFRRKVEALSTAHPALRFLCTGPWPAYSFVTATVPETAANILSAVSDRPSAVEPVAMGETADVSF